MSNPLIPQLYLCIPDDRILPESQALSSVVPLKGPYYVNKFATKLPFLADMGQVRGMILFWWYLLPRINAKIVFTKVNIANIKYFFQ